MAATASPSSAFLFSSSQRTLRRRSSLPRCSLGKSPELRSGRRQSLLAILSLATPMAAFVSMAEAKDIPLFGLRSRLRKIEEEAEEVVREGEKAVEGIVKEGEKAVEEGIEAAEREIGAAAVGEATGLELGFGTGLAQAGAVAAAEAVAVLAAVSVVNGILGSEARNS
ncbi:homolog of Synechocystis YCF37 [Wolffia australiana]